MGSSGAMNNQEQMQQEAQFQAQQQSAQAQQDAAYSTQLTSEQTAFNNYLNASTSINNQSLAPQGTVPNGGALGVLSPSNGSYLSTSSSRNTFLSG
jgi:hypothetical protein